MGAPLICVSSRGPKLEMWGEGDGPMGAQTEPACAPIGSTLTSYTGTYLEGDTNEHKE